MKAKRITLSDIRRKHEAAGGRTFSRENMKFFKETMKDFGIKQTDGRIFVYRRIKTILGVRVGTIWEFDPDTGDMRTRSKESLALVWRGLIFQPE